MSVRNGTTILENILVIPYELNIISPSDQANPFLGNETCTQKRHGHGMFNHNSTKLEPYKCPSTGQPV